MLLMFMVSLHDLLTHIYWFIYNKITYYISDTEELNGGEEYREGVQTEGSSFSMGISMQQMKIHKEELLK